MSMNGRFQTTSFFLSKSSCKAPKVQRWHYKSRDSPKTYIILLFLYIPMLVVVIFILIYENYDLLSIYLLWPTSEGLIKTKFQQLSLGQWDNFS